MNIVLAQDIAPILVPIILVAVFGIIVLVVVLVKRKVKFFQNDEKPKSDREIAAEELDRILEPIEEEIPEEGKPEAEAPVEEKPAEEKPEGEEAPKE